MSTFEEKVIEVSSLIKQRDEINKRLAELLGMEIGESQSEEKTFKKKAEAARYFLSKYPNKTAKEISILIEEAGFRCVASDIYAYKTKEKPKKEKIPRGFTTAWDKDEEEEETDEEEPKQDSDVLISGGERKISYDDFQNLKSLQDNEVTSKDAADETKISISTVNKAFSCSDWQYFERLYPELIK